MLKNNKKYNLEIIIPAYNAHKTIINTLDSILVQQNMKNFHVTIVNDYGKNYKEILKKYKDKMPIKEITTSRNVGPGLARQLGIDNSNSKYIVFIDADDTFYDELSLSTLSEEIKKGNYDLLITDFQYERDNEIAIKKDDSTWLHGKIYKREFLLKNNIKFNNTRANEDNGFNRLIFLLNPKIKYINKITYIYKENPDSITRKDNRLYKYKGLKWLSYNINWAIREAIIRNGNEPAILYTIISTLAAMYYYYLELYDEYEVDKILIWCKDIYKLYEEYQIKILKYEDIAIQDKEKENKNKKMKKIITFEEFKNKIKNLEKEEK